jgi:hypothetical protein
LQVWSPEFNSQSHHKKDNVKTRGKTIIDWKKIFSIHIFERWFAHTRHKERFI